MHEIATPSWRPTAMVVRFLAGGCVCWSAAILGAYGLIVETPMADADALLVMAGAPAYVERVRHAGEVFRAARPGRVLLTNDGQRGQWSRTLQRNPSTVEMAVAMLERAGVPREAIDVLPDIVYGTADEARAVRRYAHGRSIRTLLVVTSPYHSRRAVWTLSHFLRAEGVRVGSDPVPPTPTTPGLAFWWGSLAGWRTVGTEFVKLPYYWVVHGVGLGATRPSKPIGDEPRVTP